MLRRVLGASDGASAEVAKAKQGWSRQGALTDCGGGRRQVCKAGWLAVEARSGLRGPN